MGMPVGISKPTRTPAHPTGWHSHSDPVLQPGKIPGILASIGELPYEWDILSDVLTWGDNVGAVLQIVDPAAIATDRAFAALVGPHTTHSRRDEILRSAQQDAGDGVPYQIQYSILAAGKSVPIWVEDTGRWFGGADGRPVRAHGMLRVINERRAWEDRLSYLSCYDDLTGEMNSGQFTDRLADTLREALEHRSSFGLLIVSIDDLARINEAYGFAVGNEVIAAVAHRLRASMRDTDDLGRLAGNKFGLILRQCGSLDLRLAAERLMIAVRDEVVHATTGPVAVTASMGGIVAPRDARTLDELLARVNEALNTGKLRRRGSFQIFHPNVEREALRRENMRASDAIVSALNDRRIVPAFEPVVAAGSRGLAFRECLMRIRRPDGGLIAASDVMPVAERLGLVRLIDHRILELVMAELADTPDLRLSVNVSPASTIDGTWWNALAAALASRPSLAPQLIVELTESAAIQHLDDTRAFVARVKDLGCRVAIDDFGAGCTSFRNMRKLGVDLVKIDGGFVTNLAQSPDDQAFVRMLIGLARQLNLETVAEWVQDEASAALLTEWGCDYLQGALIGRATTDRAWCDAASPARARR